MTDSCLRCQHTQDAHGGDKDCMCGECMWFVSPSEAAESALTEARAEVERLRFSAEQHALANGGCVPKPAYDDLGEEAWRLKRRAESAEAALTSEREAHAGLRARLEALADEWREKAEDRRGRRDRIPRGGSLNQERDRAEWQGESRVYGHAAGSIHVALAAEPAAPVAAEEGGEQEAGEAACEHETTVVLHSPGDDEWAVACAVCTPEPSRWLDVGLTYEDAAALAQRHQESTP